MNMNSVLHRTDKAMVTDTHDPSTPDSAPPTPPSAPPAGAPQPWPMRAKALVAVLIAAVVLGTVGTAIGLASGGDDATERDLRADVASLTQERNAALADVRALDDQLATVRLQLQTAQTISDDLGVRVEDLEAQIATLTQQRAEALATAAELETEVTELTAKVEALGADVKTANDRAAAAIAERDALASQFPVTFDVPLGDAAMIGTYDVSLREFHCLGLSTCGTAPSLDDLTVRSTSTGLRFAIPGFAEAGLLPAKGAYHTVVDTNSAIPACDGVPRTARVTMTMFPGTTEIKVDTVPEFVNLNGVMTIESAATGNCPAALAFYSAEFSPHA